MARAMATVADERYRAVIKFKKVGPDQSDAYRDMVRQYPHIQANIHYWEEQWAKDDATVGSESDTVIGHYDTITPVKQAVNKAIKRRGSNYVVVSLQFQKAPLVWEDCDDRGN